MYQVHLPIYKAQGHQGGISAQLVVQWPAGLEIDRGSTTHLPGHIKDTMPTLINISGAEYSKEKTGYKFHVLPDNSFLYIFKTVICQFPDGNTATNGQ